MTIDTGFIGAVKTVEASLSLPIIFEDVWENALRTAFGTDMTVNLRLIFLNLPARKLVTLVLSYLRSPRQVVTSTDSEKLSEKTNNITVNNY